MFMKWLLPFLFVVFNGWAQQHVDRVLVFTKTEGFRHTSIEVGVQTFKALGEEHGFNIFHTENAAQFTDENLKQFKVVVFLNTTGNVLNSSQEEALQGYVNQGGSFMGVHAATDTEFDWPWYGKLVGAYFENHPKPAEAILKKTPYAHQATAHLEAEWEHFDEWYNFKSISNDIQVLLFLDESSYSGGENGRHHPIAWCQEFDGGRMFYTGLGHTVEAYNDTNVKQHLLGGILYCLRR